MRKILIACDKFKGSLAAHEVCSALAAGMLDRDPSLDISILPMADGGDGTLEVLKQKLDLQKIRVSTTDPLGRSIESHYLSDGSSAYVELALSSGIVRLDPSEYNILDTSTIGTGTLIQDALQSGHEHIVLSVGGSCSNDMGLGILCALGVRLYNSENLDIAPIGRNLNIITRIDTSKMLHCKITILCDVSNPLYGPTGAAHIYGPQKGATPRDILALDDGMRCMAECIQSLTGKDVSTLAGGGAAGGVAAGLYGILDDVELYSGFDYLAKVLDLEQHIASADLVVSGEGKLDDQSFQGKVVGQVFDLCHRHQVPLVLAVGDTDIKELSNKRTAVYSTKNRAKSLEDSLHNTPKYLREIGSSIYDSFLSQ